MGVIEAVSYVAEKYLKASPLQGIERSIGAALGYFFIY